MGELEAIEADIKGKIFTIRVHQVMLDRDLAELYGVETRVLKQAVNRNIKRFPADFMFVLTTQEIEKMVSQFVIPSKKHLGGAKPYAFTEQGVAMISSVLKSDRAIEINIKIMRAFVSVKNFLSQNAGIFQRLEGVEQKLIKTDQKVDKIFKALEDKSLVSKQGVFFDGQIFDAYRFVIDLISTAKKQIVLIDNYIDENTFLLFAKCKGIKITIYTQQINKKLSLDLAKFTAQYFPIKVEVFKNSHDRFLIIDGKEVYHFGASLKDLGKRWFAFNKFEMGAVEILGRLES